MMRLFEVRLFLPEGERTVSSFGSLLHGALMERLPGDLAKRLHEQDMRPYSQSVSWDKKGGEARLGERRLLMERSFEEIADAFFLTEAPPKGAELSFCTPTSFKREGRYVMLPEFFLICQSLLMRWNRFAGEVQLYEADLTQRLASACRLLQYALHSAPFSVEGHTIYGFRGNLRVRFFGTDGARRILGMLFAFAPFVGVGIKTALGMGAVETKVWEG